MTNLELIDKYLKNALNVAFVERNGNVESARNLIDNSLMRLFRENLPFTEEPPPFPQAE